MVVKRWESEQCKLVAHEVYAYAAVMNEPSPVRRRPTNVSLDPDLVDEAKALGVNLSRACESGLQAELKAERWRRWRAENADAIESSNQWVRENGLPLARFRQF